MVGKRPTRAKRRRPRRKAARRRADGRLAKFVRRQPLAKGTLPLIHTTRAYSFDGMLIGNYLKPTKCPVFDEPLLYFFYGRPAYRARSGNNGRLEFDWPIVFVFDPSKVPDLTRVFPFDSGAFELGFYEEFFSNDSRLEDFALEPTFKSARRIVGGFYRDNEEYYTGMSRKNVAVGLRQFEAQGILELSRLPGTQILQGKRDERSSAIEVQIGEAVSFKDALLAVVLPEPYLDDAAVVSALARWEVSRIETYSPLQNTSGDVWVGQIYEITRRILEKLGYLDERRSTI